MSGIHTIKFRLNGRAVAKHVEPRTSAADMIRHESGLTGTHVGCEHGVCGACSIVLDGAVVRGCLVFAVQLDGAEVETIEGASDSGRIAALQATFVDRNALQCGFCTPGMLLTAAELLSREPNPSREQIREALSGNICRCTGYEAIVDAVAAAAKVKP
jgi:aerobic-type carbon monoxide dehydrogenase small subunit (CoxS/CutS family)